MPGLGLVGAILGTVVLITPNLDGQLMLDRLLYPAQPMRCAGSQALVVLTGASTGIGRDAALELVRRGFTVLGTVRKPADAANLTQAASGAAGRLLPVICDVRDDQSVQRLKANVTALRGQGKRLIGLVNNAGVSARHGYDDFVSGKAAEDAAWMSAVNQVGIVRTTGALLPALSADAAECGSARIVNVGSLAGYVAAAESVVYSSTKGAVERMSDGLRRLLAGRKIWVSIIQPGFVESEMCNRAQCKGTVPSDTTTPAILHALVDSRPRTRYGVAGAAGFPTWMIRSMMSHLHDCVTDLIISTFS